MKDFVDFFLSKISDVNFILLVATIISIIWGIYSKIQFLCLKKASEMVAKAEGMENLTGEQKFELVVLWIQNSLPTIFKNSVFTSIIEHLIDFVYNYSFKYMKNYIKRKTGKDVSEVIDQIKDIIDESKEEDSRVELIPMECSNVLNKPIDKSIEEINNKTN